LFRFARARGIAGPGFGGGSSTALRILSVAHNQQIRTKRVVAVSGYMKAQNARTSRRNATMKQTGFAFTLLAILLMSCNPAQAQKPASKPRS